jgi:hypothetical protein
VYNRVQKLPRGSPTEVVRKDSTIISNITISKCLKWLNKNLNLDSSPKEEKSKRKGRKSLSMNIGLLLAKVKVKTNGANVGKDGGSYRTE